MELILIYFIIKKIKERTKEYEYNSAPHIKLAVILWLTGEIVGFLLGSKLGLALPIIYLMAVTCGGLGGFFVYRKVMSLPKRNLDYFDLRQSKSAYPFLDSDEPEVTDDRADAGQKDDEEDVLPFWLGEPKGLINEKKEINTEEIKEEKKVDQTNAFFQEPIKKLEQPFNKLEQPVNKPFNQLEQPVNKPFNHPEQPFNKPEQPVSKNFDKPEQPVMFYEQPLENLKVPEQLVTLKPETTKMREEPVAATNSHFFKFPYSELAPLDELLIAEYGQQTVKDKAVSEFEWFGKFKSKYENREIRLALIVLENALYESVDNGFIWLLYGVLYKDVYQNYDKALQFLLTGAKRCNSYKSALLTEAAEIILLGLNNIPLAFKFFCHAINSITETSKAWGQPGATGAITQERAFHYIRILLTVYNFNDYRLYLERNVRFHTGLDQTLIERVIALCNGATSREEVEVLIRHLFPLIIEKLQSLG